MSMTYIVVGENIQSHFLGRKNVLTSSVGARAIIGNSLCLMNKNAHRNNQNNIGICGTIIEQIGQYYLFQMDVLEF